VGTETILKIFSASNDESSTDRSAVNGEQMDGIHYVELLQSGKRNNKEDDYPFACRQNSPWRRQTKT
jgi:hypothetical protein